MLVVKIDDLNNIKVEPEEVHPMYSPVSYNAGYNQALKDIKEAYNGLTIYDTDIPGYRHTRHDPHSLDEQIEDAAERLNRLIRFKSEELSEAESEGHKDD